MICVITDHFTKFVIYTACRNTIDSEELARLYSKRLYGIFGMPRRVISDRGSVFVSEFTRTLMKIHGIEGNPSTAYHPQTDGQTERQNQELEAYLRIWVSYHQDDWTKWLSSAQFRYNNLVHSATGYSPIIALTGKQPYSGYNPRVTTNMPGLEALEEQRNHIRDEVSAALAESKRLMKEQYDKHIAKARPYQEGDIVWVSAKNLKSKRPMKKLDALRYGPFKIVKRTGPSAYKLVIPPTWKQRNVHDVFNEVYLTPFIGPAFPNQVNMQPPPPDIVNRDEVNEEEYEVETILNSRKQGHTVQYLVKWAGYSDLWNLWEDWDDLASTRDKILDFHRLHPNKPKHPSLLARRQQPRRR